MSLQLEQDSDQLLGAGAAASASDRPRWWQKEDGFLSITSSQPGNLKSSTRRSVPIWMLVLTLAALLLSVVSLAVSVAKTSGPAAAAAAGAQQQSRPAAAWPQIKRIAFSSCTSYDLRPQPIWTEGVIPSNPDAWVWLGDITYMDDPLLDCAQVPSFPECQCEADFMKRPPFQCYAGDIEHARTRMLHQLSIPEYQAFLAFMCPGYQASGLFPPLGSDPSMCPRPIFGTYDDHDFGWNNGNGRNPNKHEIKNIYLDGIGERRDSPRRGSNNGLQAAYTLPGPGSSSSSRSSSSSSGLVDEIQLVLLDERYFRETLPCSIRRDWCTAVLHNASHPETLQPSKGDVAFCVDFLLGGGLGQGGSCCSKDDEWSVWCSKMARLHVHQPVRHELCDPTSAAFGQRLLLLDTDNTTVLPLSDDLWTNRQQQLSRRLLEATSSPIWDFHYSDLKVVQPGVERGYAQQLQTGKLAKPVYQAMGSGMTYSTAEHKGSHVPCTNSYREDRTGLRPLGRCSYVSDPGFSMLEVDWQARVVSLSVRNHTNGEVAYGVDGSRQLIQFSLDTCELLKD
ncbi:hypothetical protein OEZ86_001015 [Tetradesmus obliquus]|nr:hypothetical protein OEZ86_001015 [Tetradesmus obliquus]